MDLESLWQKLARNGKIILRKSIPYVLAAVLASATVFAVLGVQGAERDFISINDTKEDLESQKSELEAALQQTQALLNQLTALNSDTKDLLEEAELEESAVADKLEELKAALENLQNKEQQRWILPMQYTMCTSSFGSREHPVAGEAKFHYGVDLAAARGTPIVASRSGTVKAAAYDKDNEGYYVNIDHLDGYVSRYMHMDKYIVTEGQFVVAGQIIGYCGDSGIATGVHLHFGIYKDGEAVNPADYIDLK